MPAAAADHYRALGVSPDAPEAAVRDAFRRLALALHPDKARGSDGDGGAAATAAFATVQRAWEVLRDPAARSAYDAELRAAATGAAPAGYKPATHTSGTITADDLDGAADGDGDGDEAGSFRCRCGDALRIALRAFRALPEPLRIVGCASCSLRYRVEPGGS